jgi:hypothetical protein
MFALESIRKILLVSYGGTILLLNVEQTHEISLHNNEMSASMFDIDLDYFVTDITYKINTSIILPTRYDKKFNFLK